MNPEQRDAALLRFARSQVDEIAKQPHHGDLLREIENDVQACKARIEVAKLQVLVDISDSLRKIANPIMENVEVRTP